MPIRAETLELVHIRTWKRGDLGTSPIMSASSGPKDYIRNGIWVMFDEKPEIERIVMVRAARGGIGYGTMFALYRTALGWFDCTGKRVILQNTEAPDAQDTVSTWQAGG